MARVLENRESHALVQHDDNTVELVPWSDMNKLLYKHGLEGVVATGTELLELTHEDAPDVAVTPNDDATEFTLTVGAHELHVGAHEKNEFLDVLLAAYEAGDDDGPSHQPFVDYAAERLDLDVDPDAVDPLAEHAPFADHVDPQDGGWLIHDHVLLTYGNEFYHPDTTGKTRSGGVLDENANRAAYEMRIRSPASDGGQLQLSAFSGLGNTEDHVEFVSRALWAIQYTPEVPPDR